MLSYKQASVVIGGATGAEGDGINIVTSRDGGWRWGMNWQEMAA